MSLMVSINHKKGIITYTHGNFRWVAPLSAVQDLLWERATFLVKAHTITTISENESIRYQIDWRSVLSSHSAKIIIIRYGTHFSKCTEVIID